MKNEKEFHIKSAAHHLEMCKCMTAAASCHSELSQKADAASFHKDLANCYSKAADEHAAMAEYHVACAKNCDGDGNPLPTVGQERRTNDRGEGLRAAFGINDLDKLAPSPVQAINRMAGGLQLVPREGAPNMSPIPDDKISDDMRKALGTGDCIA